MQSQARTESIRIRLSPQLRETLQGAAARRGLTLSEVIRDELERGLGLQPEPQYVATLQDPEHEERVKSYDARSPATAIKAAKRWAKGLKTSGEATILVERDELELWAAHQIETRTGGIQWCTI